MPDRTTRTSNQTLLQNNAQISLLYQLEQRKNHKLEEENRSLHARIRALTTDTDDARIKLLVADRTKRKLVQLKAITNRTIASLESGLKAFNDFVTDIDKAVVEQTKQGAVTTLQVCSNPKLELMNAKFDPKLSRIAESPLLVSCQASSVLQETINLTCEPSIVLDSVPDVGAKPLQTSKENIEGVVRRSRKTANTSPQSSSPSIDQKANQPQRKIIEVSDAASVEDKTPVAAENTSEKKQSLRRSTRKTLILEEELSSPIQFYPPSNYVCKPGRESSFFGGQALTPVFTSTPKPEKVSSSGRSKSTNYLQIAKQNQIKESQRKSIEEMLGQEQQLVVEIEPCKNISAMVNGVDDEPVVEQPCAIQAEVLASAHKNITERCRRTISNESSNSSEAISDSIQSYSDSVLITPVVVEVESPQKQPSTLRRPSGLRRRKSIFIKPMEETDSVVDDSNPSFKSISSQPSLCSVDLQSSKKREPPTYNTPGQHEEQEEDQTITLVGSALKKKSKKSAVSTDCTGEENQTEIQKTFAISQSSSTCNMSEQQTGRQKRNAVTKVASYKMPSLNKKMRRVE